MVVERDDGTRDIAETFVLMMHEEYDRLHDLIWAEEEMKPLTPEELLSFQSSASCYLCEKPMTADDKVMDHCHYTLVHLIL